MPNCQQSSDKPIRVLVAEDEIMIAMDIQGYLQQVGFEAVGPALTLKDFKALAASERIDGAIVDLGLLGHEPEIALAPLVAQNVATILLSGYDADKGSALPCATERMDKPAYLPDVVGRLRELMKARSSL